jgi:hypothetical protein
MNWRKLYLGAAITLANTVILFVLLNLLLWPVSRAYNARHPNKVHPDNPIAQFGIEPYLKAYRGWSEADVREVVREHWLELKWEYDPVTQFRLAPTHVRFMNVEPAGYRLVANQGPWPPDPKARNIFVFGGSTAFGSGLGDAATVPSQMQQAGDALHPAPPVHFYNFAVPGHTSTLEALRFAALLRKGFVPTDAVFIDGLNDCFFAGKTFFEILSGLGLSNQAEPCPSLCSLPLIGMSLAALKSLAPQPPPNPDDLWTNQQVKDVVLKRWNENRKFIDTLAAAYGVKTFFVWQPIPFYKYDRRYQVFGNHNPAGLPHRAMVSVYPAVEDLAKRGRMGSNFLFLGAMQTARHENLYVDLVHYTAPFSHEIAERIVGFLRAHQVF